MKIPTIDHWQNQKDLEGLLFFAQLLDEMLFDYTLDSHKPLALNSRTLCRECLETIREVEEGNISDLNLLPVVEELKWSLNSDLAAKEILGRKFGFYLEKLSSAPNKLQILKTVVSFIYDAFDHKKYLNTVKKALIGYIKEGRAKDKINSLTGVFITELINHGYHPSFIYYQNNSFFFTTRRKEVITSVDDLEEFFETFNFVKEKFTVVFLVDGVLKHFRDALKSFGLGVSQRYTCFSQIAEDQAFSASRKPHQSFIFYHDIESLDHHSAREQAEQMLGSISSLFNFYHHKRKPDITEKVVVCRNKDNYVVVLDKPTNSILKIKTDQMPKTAAASVEQIFFKLKFTDESNYRLFRSFELHSMALASSAVPNQLLNLWAAIETMLPKSSDSSRGRISQIAEKVVPFLQLNYVQKHLSELLANLKLWDARALDEAFRKLPDYKALSDLERVASLTALTDNAPLRKDLYSRMNNSPLLRYRLYKLHEFLKTPMNIKKMLENHDKKVNWHLRRIYRTRGYIVHSGSYPKHLPTLVENLHNYLDIFINRILQLAKEKKITSIEHGILEVRLMFEYQQSLLNKHLDENLTSKNFRESIFGDGPSDL